MERVFLRSTSRRRHSLTITASLRKTLWWASSSVMSVSVVFLIMCLEVSRRSAVPESHPQVFGLQNGSTDWLQGHMISRLHSQTRLNAALKTHTPAWKLRRRPRHTHLLLSRTAGDQDGTSDTGVQCLHGVHTHLSQIWSPSRRGFIFRCTQSSHADIDLKYNLFKYKILFIYLFMHIFS